MKNFLASVEKKAIIALETSELTFKLTEPFTFSAGQYITITLPSLKDLPVREQSRDFSIASLPEYTGRIMIATRNSESPFKQELLKGGLGMEIFIEGPKGIFTLPESLPGQPVSGQNICFIAGGIGITVFLCIIRHLIFKKIPVKPTLFFYNRDRESTPYLAELEGYSASINLVPVFGDMTKTEIESYIKAKPDGNLWYLAGPRGMVKTAREILTGLKVEEKAIKSEEYSRYE